MFPSAGNILFGLLAIVLGFFMITKAYYINHQIYFLSFFERKWGPGGGTLAYKAIGVAFIFFALFVLTGWIDLFDTGQTTSQSPTPTGQTITPRSSIEIAP